MFENILVVAQQVGVLFMLMGVGFVLGKLDWIDEYTAGRMSRLLMYVVSPCTVIHSLQVEFTAALMAALGAGCLILVGQYLVMILFSQLTFRKQPPERRSVLRFGQVYSNNVFMGLPLLQAVLGAQASVFVVPSMIMFNIFEWTHGVSIMGGKMSAKKLLISPGMIGILIGMSLFVGQITLPMVFGKAVSYLAGMNTPLAMVIIGTQMARADLKSTFTNARLYLISASKLLLAPVVVILIMLPFRAALDPEQFCALTILSAAPCAGMTSIFAQRYGRDTATAAQSVSLSTLLSLFTLPLFAALAQTMIVM